MPSIQTYAKARGWLIKKADLNLLQKETKRWMEKRWQRYEKKIQRNCTAFARKSTVNALKMYDCEYHSAELSAFLKNPEALFLHPDTQTLKAGRSSTVVKVTMDGKNFVIKRYNIKGIWHWLRRCLRVTRARNSWTLALQLRLFGLPTPKPIAFIENHVLGLRGRSYFLMEYVEGPDAGEYFSNYREDDAQFAQTAESIIGIFYNLLKLKLTHGDLKKSNILISDHGPILLDLDGMVEHSGTFGLRRVFRKESDRFMKNWENMPSVRELFAESIRMVNS